MEAPGTDWYTISVVVYIVLLLVYFAVLAYYMYRIYKGTVVSTSTALTMFWANIAFIVGALLIVSFAVWRLIYFGGKIYPSKLTKVKIIDESDELESLVSDDDRVEIIDPTRRSKVKVVKRSNMI